MQKSVISIQIVTLLKNATDTINKEFQRTYINFYCPLVVIFNNKYQCAMNADLDKSLENNSTVTVCIKSFFKSGKSISQLFSAIILLGIFITVMISCTTRSAYSERWVGTWATAPQLVELRNLPPEPGLSNNTLHQVVRISIGGDSLRVKFSNEFSDSPVSMRKVGIALLTADGIPDSASSKELTFKGTKEVTMEAGSKTISDPIYFRVEDRTDIVISIFFGETSPTVTGHPGSRTTSYLLEGDKIASIDFQAAIKTDHWYVINGIDVKAPASSASLVILGNSITDGRGSGTNKQNRWPDILSESLLANPGTEDVGVLNMGIGGNCVLRDCLGPSAIDRFERDVLSQAGVKWLIVLEGVNDLGGTRDSTEADRVADALIGAFETMISEAHSHDILVYGATILPFGNSFYYTSFRESARNKVNQWIRNSGTFDAVIDFDRHMRDPQDTLCLLPTAHTGDFLHPNEEGYIMMGKYIDPVLFE